MMEIIIEILKGLSVFGNKPAFIVVITALTIAYLLTKKSYMNLVILMFSILSYPFSLLLKGFYRISNGNRAAMNTLFPVDKFSFPSTHVVFYTVFFGFLLYLTFDKSLKMSVLTKNVMRWLSVVLISFIGTSRYILGMHTLKDILFGYLFGATYLFLIVAVHKSLQKS